MDAHNFLQMVYAPNECLALFHRNLVEVFYHFVIMDETCIHYYTRDQAAVVTTDFVSE